MALAIFNRSKRKKAQQPKAEAEGSPQTEAAVTEADDKGEGGGQGGNADLTRADVEHPEALLSEALSKRGQMLEASNKLHRRTVLALLATNLLTGAAAYIGMTREVQYRYFFTNTDGSVLDAKPLSDPIHSQAVIRNFLSKSMAQLFSFHYRNVEMHLQRFAPDVLTEQAFQDLVSELDRMGLVSDMKTRREVAVATIQDTPVLAAHGVQNGVRTWEYAAKLRILLESAEQASGSRGRGETRQLAGRLRAQLIRVPAEQHPRRVLINRIQIVEEGVV